MNRAEKILSEETLIDVGDLRKKHELSIIRPSEAIEAMEEIVKEALFDYHLNEKLTFATTHEDELKAIDQWLNEHIQGE